MPVNLDWGNQLGGVTHAIIGRSNKEQRRAALLPLPNKPCSPLSIRMLSPHGSMRAP